MFLFTFSDAFGPLGRVNCKWNVYKYFESITQNDHKRGEKNRIERGKQ